VEHEIKILKEHNFRHKIALFAVVGFLFVISFVVISISRQLANSDGLTLRSRAEEANPSLFSGNQTSQNNDFNNNNPSLNNQKIDNIQSCCDAQYYRSGPDLGPLCNPGLGGCDKPDCMIKCDGATYNRWPGRWSEESCAAKAKDVCGCYPAQEFCVPVPNDTPIVLPGPEATVAPTASPTATLIPSPTTPSNCRGVAYPSQNNQGLAMGCYGNRFNQAQIRCYQGRIYQTFCNARSMGNNICYSSDQWQQIANQVCCSGECQNAQTQNRTLIITAPTNP